MKRAPTLALLLLTAAAAPSFVGCAHTTRETRTRDLSTTTELVRRAPVKDAENTGPLSGTFTVEGGVLRGQVTWQTACEEAKFRLEQDEEVATTKSDKLANVALALASVGVVVLSVALIADADEFSTSEASCTQDEIDRNDCTTSREAAVGLGVVGVLLGVAGTAVGAVGMTRDDRVEVTPLGPPDKRLLARSPDPLLCGQGPATGFGLALRRLTQTVAQSSLNQVGEVAFALPPGLSGEVEVVVDIVPPESTRLVRVGEVLGRVTIGP